MYAQRAVVGDEAENAVAGDGVAALGQLVSHVVDVLADGEALLRFGGDFLFGGFYLFWDNPFRLLGVLAKLRRQEALHVGDVDFLGRNLMVELQ